MTRMLDGPAGPLEVKRESPAVPAGPEGLALICHPHPLYGGTFDNKVVVTLSRCALACGLTSVRFNFRGVGQSAGVYGEGVGETEDAAAVLAWAQVQQPGARIVLMGFSFGAAIALRLALRVAAAQLVTVAAPLTYFDHEPIRSPACPWLLVHGDADEVAPWPETETRLQDHGLAPQRVILSGVEHFFHGHLGKLREVVEAVLRARWQTLA